MLPVACVALHRKGAIPQLLRGQSVKREKGDRSAALDGAGNPLPVGMHATDRAAVAKIKYLYYL
jgi:hypothetical protein